MMELLTQLLLTISNALLIPDILILLLFFMLIILYLGGLIAEAVVRWQRGPVFWRLIRELKMSPGRHICAEEIPAGFGLVQKGFREIRAMPGAVEKVLDDLQLEAERLIGRLNLGIRLGPILGLAGTLIPLGPALVALATGDIETLAARLAIAFTTTVLGLLIGGACFAMHSVRAHWYTQDLNDIEFVAKRIK